MKLFIYALHKNYTKLTLYNFFTIRNREFSKNQVDFSKFSELL